MAINRPTLAITDNASSSTGGTATISSSTSGTINELYYQTVNGKLGTATWTLLSERTGDGTISFSLDVGYYWFHVVSTVETNSGSDSGGTDSSESVSNFVYQNITNGSDSIYEQCLTGVQAHIQTLSLSGLDDNNVVIHKVAEETKVNKPAVIISPAGSETSAVTSGTNTRDDYGYPIFVGIVAADNRDQTTNRNQYLKWREQIMRAFQNQRLSGVTDVIRIQVETRDVVAPAWFANQLFVSSMVVRCFARLTRGLT